MEFDRQFATEEACRAYVMRLRWPEGFRCPRCGDAGVWRASRGRLICRECQHETWITAGTIFHRSHAPLLMWFKAIWWMTSRKPGVSALGLQRVLGLGSYRTAWLMLHKLRRAMVRPGREPLEREVEVDEAYVGGAEVGVHGRETLTKALVAIAAEMRGRGTGRIRLKAYPERLSGDVDALRAGVRGEGRDGAHGRVGWVCEVAGERLPAPASRATRRRPSRRDSDVAPCAPGGEPAQDLAPGHPSRGRGREASSVLSRRVRVPVQPPHLPLSGQALLPCA